MKFSLKLLRIGNFEKLPFFESAILDFFFQKKDCFVFSNEENLRFHMRCHFFEILMITLVSSQKSLSQNISAGSVSIPDKGIFEQIDIIYINDAGPLWQFIQVSNNERYVNKWESLFQIIIDYLLIHYSS